MKATPSRVVGSAASAARMKKWPPLGIARDLMVQEVGYAHLRHQGIELVASDSPYSFVDDTLTARLVRQVLGAIAVARR